MNLAKSVAMPIISAGRPDRVEEDIFHGNLVSQSNVESSKMSESELRFVATVGRVKFLPAV